MERRLEWISCAVCDQVYLRGGSHEHKCPQKIVDFRDDIISELAAEEMLDFDQDYALFWLDPYVRFYNYLIKRGEL